MPRSITFTIPGKPMAKQRLRMTVRGNVYTPAQTVNYENLVKTIAFSLMEKGKIKLSDKYFAIEIKAYFQIPKSYSKKKVKMIENKELRPKLIDADNIAKIILDALNGIVYKDDKQVSELHVHKFYDNQARVKINIKELN